MKKKAPQNPVFSAKITSAQDAKLRRLAERTKRSRSDIVRLLIECIDEDSVVLAFRSKGTPIFTYL